MRDARETVEADVVLLRAAAQHLRRAAAQVGHLLELAREGVDRVARGDDQRLDARGAALTGIVAVLAQVGAAALLDFGETVVQRLDQERAALRVVEQIVLQIRIAAHDPDVAEHFVEHARGAAGAALRAQFRERTPRLLAEQTDDDFAIRKRRVVVGDLAQARLDVGGHGGGGAVRIEDLRCVHGWTTLWVGTARTAR